MNWRDALALLWIEMRAQGGRLSLAGGSVALGVALALAIHLVNQSALREFSRALAVVNGQSQAQIVSARTEAFDEAMFMRLLNEPALSASLVAASPVIEIRLPLEQGSEGSGENFRLFGVDPLRAAAVTPRLIGQPAPEAGDAGGAASTLFGDDTLFVSAALLARWQLRVGESIEIGLPGARARLQIAGTLPGAQPGQLLAVADIATVQWRFGWLGKLSRIDLRWSDSVNGDAARDQLAGALGPAVRVLDPDLAEQQASNLSRAYRVNLSVLSLVATFTGGFLVWTSLASAVSRQTHGLAVLAILGASRAMLNRAVLLMGLAVGAAGTLAGTLLGVGLARWLLDTLGADLGAGYFSGGGYSLDLGFSTLTPFVLLGLATALAGAWSPARQAASLPIASSLRGQLAEPGVLRTGMPMLLLVAGAALLTLPAIAGLPLAAYVAIACWLMAGVMLTPHGLRFVGRLLALFENQISRSPALWLALHRYLGDRASARQSGRAAAAVVASFALASAMAIMVFSFRSSVSDWLNQVLPADLYARAAQHAGEGSLSDSDQQAMSSWHGVERVIFLRSLAITLAPDKPALTLLARPLDPSDVSRSLPVTGMVRPPPAGNIALHVTESAAAIHGLRVGSQLELPSLAPGRTFWVASIWRDYARQNGALAIDLNDYRQLTGDTRVNEVALWKKPGVDDETILSQARNSPGSGLEELQWRSAEALKVLSLKIFDRSFALTYVLEAIAIAVALVGVIAGFGSQALARVREFAVCRHLGLSRAELLLQLAAESVFLLGIAVAWGLVLGLAISAVLVFRVNPQSFHWSMDMRVPIAELFFAGSALIALGSVAAVLTARRIMAPRLLASLKEDW